MDESKTYVNVKFAKTDPQSPSNYGLTSTYSELNFPKDELLIAESEDHPIASGPGEQPITVQTDVLTSTYTELKFCRDDPPIDKDEDPPIASGPGGLQPTAQTDAQKRESKVKIRYRLNRLICLLCLVTSALVVIVVGLSIHVSQIRWSQEKRNKEFIELNATQRQCLLQVHELNSTLQSRISEISKLDLSRRTCLTNLSALNATLSVIERVNTELSQNSTEMETKYRSVNETKAQICEWLTGRRERACPQLWIRNEDRCYFICTVAKSYDEAKQHCSHSEANLLEINSTKEANFIDNTLVYQNISYWIGKCKAGELDSNVVFKFTAGKFECSECKSNRDQNCKNDQHYFICEKSALLCPDVPEMIQDLCQQPGGPTSIK